VTHLPRQHFRAGELGQTVPFKCKLYNPVGECRLYRDPTTARLCEYGGEGRAPRHISGRRGSQHEARTGHQEPFETSRVAARHGHQTARNLRQQKETVRPIPQDCRH
jgi:hypothetical protein